MVMNLPDLPITSASFVYLRQHNLRYVDKTRHLASLLKPANQYVFLARPRRFGKTLLVSTLEAWFQGEREWFRDTWIHDHAEQTQSHPVIRLSMQGLDADNADVLRESLLDYIQEQYEIRHLPLPAIQHVGRLFSRLIQILTVHGPVVVLIDEYDAPIVSNLVHPDRLPGILTVLHNFYGILKERDQDLRFVLLTGVSRFARVSIFSGLNNLRDISLHPDYSDLLGFTETELTESLAPYIAAAAKAMGQSPAYLHHQLQKWYNGYLFAPGGTRVYNPYSILNCLTEYALANYWAISGTPTFLVDRIRRDRYDLTQLTSIDAERVAQATYVAERPDLATLMYQTGYLTLQPTKEKGRYQLGYPNHEVARTFNESLLEVYLEQPLSHTPIHALQEALGHRDLDRFFALLNDVLAQIPHPLFRDAEWYYQALWHQLFIVMGHVTDSEVSTHLGRLDTAVHLSPDEVILLEYKLDDTPEAALYQLERKGYARKYQARGQRVCGVGVQIDRQARQIVAWSTRLYDPPADDRLQAEM